MEARAAHPHLRWMDLDRLFGLVASIALLLYLLPGAVPLEPRRRAALRRAAGWLLGGALSAAVLYAILWFAGFA